MDKAHRTDIEFNAEGVTLRGWLYRPAHADAASHLPVIIMTPGYNAIKELYLDCFAEYFAERGMIVLVYDNRNFGDSDGEPRGELDPWVQVRDYRHAITFAQQLPGVDPLRVGIWGSSYSGGHVLVVGAIDRRVKCVVSQVMTTNGYESLVRRQRPDHLYDLYRRFEQDRKARFAGAKPEYVPMVTAPEAPTGQIRSHASNDAFVFFTGVGAPASDAWRFKKWNREITLRSIEMHSEYEPASYIARIAPTPLLMVIGHNDVITPTDLQLAAYNKAHEPKKLVILDGGHFAPYVVKFKETAEAQCAWFTQHLIESTVSREPPNIF